MVGGQLNGPLVERGQEGFGEGDFGHDGLLEAGVEGIVLGEERQSDGGLWFELLRVCRYS